jgi:hypothetical protein
MSIAKQSVQQPQSRAAQITLNIIEETSAQKTNTPLFASEFQSGAQKSAALPKQNNSSACPQKETADLLPVNASHRQEHRQARCRYNSE